MDLVKARYDACIAACCGVHVPPVIAMHCGASQACAVQTQRLPTAYVDMLCGPASQPAAVAQQYILLLSCLLGEHDTVHCVGKPVLPKCSCRSTSRRWSAWVHGLMMVAILLL